MSTVCFDSICVTSTTFSQQTNKIRTKVCIIDLNLHLNHMHVVECKYLKIVVTVGYNLAQWQQLTLNSFETLSNTLNSPPRPLYIFLH